MAYRRLQFLMLTVLVAVSVTAGMFLASGLNLTPSAAAEEIRLCDLVDHRRDALGAAGVLDARYRC